VADDVTQQVLREQAAFQLANVTKTAPQYGAITPRWLVRLLDWKPLEAGTFRRNRVDEGKAIEVTCGQVEEASLPGRTSSMRRIRRNTTSAPSMPC